MKMNNRLLAFFILSITAGTRSANAQSEGLTSSPYSLYGLGIINQNGIGRSNGMGYTGVGLKSATEINNLNPAHYALIPENTFFYDLGVTGEYNNYSNISYTEQRSSLNFSNLALAFRIIEKLGAGITLVPYSDVGYSLVGIQTNIEGSNEVFESNVSGLGGLNDLRFNIGYGITDRLRIGLTGSLLFGNIEEVESFQISSSGFELTETTNYSGLRLGFGFQHDLTDHITLGSTIQYPTRLKGRLKQSVHKVLDGSEIIVEEEGRGEVSDFNMPLEIGFGMSARVFGSLLIGADYKKNYWESTGDGQKIGKFTDQDVYALGFEYQRNPLGYKYSDRIRYRGGFNYDTGYLALNDTKIEGYSITAGVGLPLNAFTGSQINLSYAYGSKGQLQNILVREDYHILTLNLSLADLWFRKRRVE